MGHFSITLVFAKAVIIVAYSVHSYGLTSDICIGDVFRCTSRNFHNLDETTSHLSQQNYPCWHATCLSSTRLRFHHSHRSPFFSFRPPTPNATKYLFFGPNSGSPAYQVIIIVVHPSSILICRLPDRWPHGRSIIPHASYLHFPPCRKASLVILSSPQFIQRFQTPRIAIPIES